MKGWRSVLAAALVCGLALASVWATAQPQRSNAGFDRLKTLVGDWDAKMGDGMVTKVTYKLVSGGTALMETVGPGTMDMVSIYHSDGEALMMTHYCEANNQPRMRATHVDADAKMIDFKFVDVTNEAMATEGIMKAVRFTFQDTDHFTQEWTSSKDGKETPMLFSYTRRK